jgi:hypothetical protein
MYILMLLLTLGTPGYFASIIVEAYDTPDKCRREAQRINTQLKENYPADVADRLEAWCTTNTLAH